MTAQLCDDAARWTVQVQKDQTDRCGRDDVRDQEHIAGKFPAAHFLGQRQRDQNGEWHLDQQRQRDPLERVDQRHFEVCVIPEQLDIIVKQV